MVPPDQWNDLIWKPVVPKGWQKKKVVEGESATHVTDPLVLPDAPRRVKEKHSDLTAIAHEDRLNDNSCVALWTAVVASAIRDTCRHPILLDGFNEGCTNVVLSRWKRLGIEVKSGTRIPTFHASSALAFLFTPARSDAILEALDIEGGHFRKNLVECMLGARYARFSTFVGMIDAAGRRNFRYNHWFWERYGWLVTKYVQDYDQYERKGDGENEDHEDESED
jgi:hypothetical protein